MGCRRMQGYGHSSRTSPKNPHYLPGAGDGLTDLATPLDSPGDGSPGTPDGGGRSGASPVHRSARRLQGACRPTSAGSSTAPQRLGRFAGMGDAETIVCPYCGTRFRLDPRLAPLEVDSFFADDGAA
jgi:hypothetical protein